VYWLNFDESGHFCHLWQHLVERKLTAMTMLTVILVLLAVGIVATWTPHPARRHREFENQLADLDALRGYRQYP
jgi:hypothetical protein